MIATTVLALLMLVPTVITGVCTPGALVLVAGIILAALVWITSPQPSGSGLVAVGVSVAVAAGIVTVQFDVVRIRLNLKDENLFPVNEKSGSQYR